MSAVQAEIAHRAEINLGCFIKYGWLILEPTTPYVSGWHLEAIVEHLSAVSAGQIRNLLINMPPRHMKSLAVSVFWPVWEWIAHPSRRWLFSSYALSLSVRDSLKCRRLIESQWFQDRWSDRFELTGDQNAKLRFENDRSGYRIASSVDSAATGEGGDRIVCDDPHNVREAESETVREATLTWWRETMSTRGNDPKTAAKVVVMQRVHEKDLSGYLLKEEGRDWCHLCLPAEYEGSKVITQIGWSDPRKESGELLWPERFGRKELDALKRSLGEYGSAGQLQQRPAPAGGGRFRSAWFRYYTQDGEFYRLAKTDGTVKLVPIRDCNRICIIDPAGTDKMQNEKACYTVIQVWDITPAYDMILVDQYREQVETPEAANAGIRMIRKWDVPWLGVEIDGIGLGVVQTIRSKGVTVRGIKAKGSKEARSETAEIRMSNGTVYLPANAPWLFDFQQELLLFPNSEHKDQVDALAHAALHVHRQAGGAFATEGDSDAAEIESAVNAGAAMRVSDGPMVRIEAAELARLKAENWDEDLQWSNI